MGALTGVIVLDLSWLFPGPYCTSLLCSMGAEVWRIERPGAGDFLRHGPAFFANLNWGKKSVTLDLGRQEGKAAFCRLAEKADVIVEGFRPGTVARLGVDYHAVREYNPKIVYCSISGFGQEGPYRNKPGHDANYQAVGGLLSLYAKEGESSDGPPLPLGDLSSGLFAAFGIVSALLERERTGEGKYLDISMTDGLFTWVALIDTWVSFSPSLGPLPGRGLPHYGPFETRDGKLLVLGVVHEDHLWKTLCEAMGLSEWKDLDYAARVQGTEWIRTGLSRVFRQRDRAEWLQRLGPVDVPVTPVNTVEEATEDPQLTTRRLISLVRGPGSSTMPLVRNPVLPPTVEIDGQGPPQLGEHTVEVLEKAGFGREEIERLRDLKII